MRNIDPDKRTIEVSTMHHAISLGFCWSNSPEGDEFWRKLHDDYRYYIRTLSDEFTNYKYKTKEESIVPRSGIVFLEGEYELYMNRVLQEQREQCAKVAKSMGADEDMVEAIKTTTKPNFFRYYGKK